MNFQKCPQIILDSTVHGNSSVLLCFGQNGQSNKEEAQNPTLIKQENKHEITENLYHVHHTHNIQSSSSGCCLPSDDRPRSSVQWPAASSGSEYGDVNSSGCTDDLAMHMMDNADVDDFTLEFLTEFC